MQGGLLVLIDIECPVCGHKDTYSDKDHEEFILGFNFVECPKCGENIEFHLGGQAEPYNDQKGFEQAVAKYDRANPNCFYDIEINTAPKFSNGEYAHKLTRYLYWLWRKAKFDL